MKISSNSFTQDSNTELINEFHQTVTSDHIGFLSYLDDVELTDAAKKIHDKFKHKKHFVQIGIGGSALGPQMLISSLQKNAQCSFTFLDNTDSDYLHRELNKISLKDSIFYVVSKSGGTAETIAAFIIVYNLLQEQGITNFSDYFVFCTDPTSGQLREFVNQNNFDALEVPSNIGGRFSVLTNVGLLPAIFAGIDIDELLTEAKNYKNSLVENLTNLSQTGDTILDLYSKGINQTVMMPYSSILKDFSFWFTQLWAESLGKKNIGITPIPAYGATDQHSQMQLFMEGPNNKFLFLINVSNKSKDFSLNSDLSLESAIKLKDYSLNQLLNAQFHGTVDALKEMKRNLATIEIEEVNNKTLAKLIIYFECLTVYVGLGLKINPFDQPGVELGKKLAYKHLNSL